MTNKQLAILLLMMSVYLDEIIEKVKQLLPEQAFQDKVEKFGGFGTTIRYTPCLEPLIEFKKIINAWHVILMENQDEK